MMQSVLSYGRLISRALVNGVQYSISTDGASVVRRRHERDLCLLTASCGFPKDWNGFTTSLLKRGQFGDDACFIAKYKNADVLGVADGVGGWRTYGVDPSLFSYSLMQTCERLVVSGNFNPRFPSNIIAASYYELQQNKRHIIGSSTVCVLVLNYEDSTMYSANIGDSGFRVFRHGHIVHRSEEQVHYFNTPFQLSLPPPNISGRVLRDSPESANTASFPLMKGDLVLLATDGLFDNLSDGAIVSQLSTLKDHSLPSIQQAVNSIALQARRLAFDGSYLSPFSMRARENGINALGGKPDDITVLLAAVEEGNGSHLKTVVAHGECNPSAADYG